MIDVAPTTSLIGSRIDWSPYFCGAVDAMLREAPIESAVSGNVHGNDVGGGVREGWVKLLELNPACAPKGSEEIIRKAIEDINAGRCHVFQGDYTGINPDDPADTWDLNTEYPENQEASAPSFHYILRDVIFVPSGYDAGLCSLYKSQRIPAQLSQRGRQHALSAKGCLRRRAIAHISSPGVQRHP